MANAAIALRNLAVDATVTASDSSILMPATRLQTPGFLTKWRSQSLTPSLLTTAMSSFRLIMLRGITASEDCTFRVRVSSADVTGAAGDVLDLTGIAHGDPEFDADYGALAVVLDDAVSGIVRIDYDEDGAGRTYVEGGWLWVSDLTDFTYNFAPGSTLRFEDLSATADTRGGQTQVDFGEKRRIGTFNFAAVSGPQRYGVIDTLDRVNGTSRDVAFVFDTASTNLARDSIIGLVADQTPVDWLKQYASDGPVFSKVLTIRERL